MAMLPFRQKWSLSLIKFITFKRLRNTADLNNQKKNKKTVTKQNKPEKMNDLGLRA